jgi:hypothetical protein
MKRIGRWFVLNGEKFYFVKVGGEFNIFTTARFTSWGKIEKLKRWRKKGGTR